MSKNDPLVGDQKIAAILQSLRGCCTPTIERKNFDCDKTTVKAVSQRETTSRSHNQPQRINGFTAPQGDYGDSQRTEAGDSQPEENR
jgi:hypothetical protein